MHPKQYKFLKSIASLKGQKKERKFLATSKKVVEEALLFQPQAVEQIYYLPEIEFSAAADEQIAKFQTPLIPEDLKKLNSIDQNSQGIIAVISAFDQPEPRKISNFSIVCESIRDPANLGGLIRLADAFGAKSVFLSPDCTSPNSVKTLRAAAGSNFHLPIFELSDFSKFESPKFTKIGTVVHNEKAQTFESIITKIPSESEPLLFFGNESAGLTPETQEFCDFLITIPTPGLAESLNVATAASILLYLCSQR